MPATDVDLVRGALDGSESAFREIVQRYQRPIYGLIVRMVRDPARAEELAQDTFVKAFRALHTYDVQRKFSAWLLTIAHHVAIDELRKGVIRLFVGLIAVGLTLKLGWDRWGILRPGVSRKAVGPPVLLWLATAVALVLLVLALRSLFAARRLARDEDRLYSRFRQLRARLGLDA